MQQHLKSSPLIRLCVQMTFAAGFGITAIGCAGNNDGGIKGMSSGEADKLNAPRAKFDSAEDPPFTADTHYAAGRLAESQNVIGGAIEQYKAALVVDPNHQGSLYRLGILQTQLKLYPAAIETWKKYVVATKNSPTAMSNLAFCYEVAGQSDEAEQAYQRGIESDPKSTACRINYGLMLARKDRISAATTQLSAVLKPAEVHYDLGSVYEQENRPGEAKSEYNKALEADPDFRDAKKRLSMMK